MKKLMLDTNVFCRPFDDLSDESIKNEAIFAEKIMGLSKNEEIEILGSDVLFAELDLIEDLHKKDIVFNEVKSIVKQTIEVNESVYNISKELSGIIGDYIDSLHISFAAASNCNCFVTCDKGIIKTRQKIEKFLTLKGIWLSILTPEEFVKNGIDIN